ncbi:MAG: IS630 family transposase [Clostridia bacterium]|jgi:transposase
MPPAGGDAPSTQRPTLRHDVHALSEAELRALTSVAASTTAPVRAVERAQALLRLQDGETCAEVAPRLGHSQRTIARWQTRFTEDGVLALFDRPRSGAPPRLSIQDVLVICETAVTDPRTLGLVVTCWSLRLLADHLREHRQIKVCPERLRQILHAHGIWKKAQVSAQRSRDPEFAQKRDRVVDLYTNPPEDALVACLDQHGPVGLHATQGASYAAPGQQPHYDREYKRHGTIYILGALLPHLGKVWARAFLHYNSLTVIWFLGWLLPQLPLQGNRKLYLILDNCSSHTAKRVSAWLAKHWKDRVHLVFLPSKAAWLNLIEPFWRVLKDQMLKGADFQSRPDFRAALRCFLTLYNRRCHPYIWGRQRKARILLVRPLRKKLRGRAGARSMPPHLLRLIARAAA